MVRPFLALFSLVLGGDPFFERELILLCEVLVNCFYWKARKKLGITWPCSGSVPDTALNRAVCLLRKSGRVGTADHLPFDRPGVEKWQTLAGWQELCLWPCSGIAAGSSGCCLPALLVASLEGRTAELEIKATPSLENQSQGRPISRTLIRHNVNSSVAPALSLPLLCRAWPGFRIRIRKESCRPRGGDLRREGVPFKGA